MKENGMKAEELFRKFDTNQDGLLSYDEFKAGDVSTSGMTINVVEWKEVELGRGLGRTFTYWQLIIVWTHRQDSKYENFSISFSEFKGNN